MSSVAGPTGAYFPRIFRTRTRSETRMGTLGARIGLPLAALFFYVSASQADPTITPQSEEPASITDPTNSAARLMSTEPKRPFWSLSGKPEVKSSAVVVFVRMV